MAQAATTTTAASTLSACAVSDASSTIVAQSLQPFCTSYLGYGDVTRTATQSTALTTSISKTLVITTSVISQTTTRTLNGTRNADATVPNGANPNKRQAAGWGSTSSVAVPPALTQCNSVVISSACSIAAPPPTTTVVVTYPTTTRVVTWTGTTTATSTVTVGVLPPFASELSLKRVLARWHFT
jgi:hypothetical protein